MDIIKEIENEQLEKLTAERPVPDFGPGDTLRVNVKVVEGTRERIQVFEGVCIGRKNAGLNSSFTVRKISYGEGVERVFQLYSPAISGIEVMRRGAVRRSKLYYLRGLKGKRARIAEKTDWDRAKTKDSEAPAEAETAPDAAAEPAPETTPEKPKKKAKKKKKAKVEVPETGAAGEVNAEAVTEAKDDAGDADKKAKKPKKKAVAKAKDTADGGENGK